MSIIDAGHNDIDTAHFTSLMTAMIKFLGPDFRECKLENRLLSK